MGFEICAAALLGIFWRIFGESSREEAQKEKEGVNKQQRILKIFRGKEQRKQKRVIAIKAIQGLEIWLLGIPSFQNVYTEGRLSSTRDV